MLDMNFIRNNVDVVKKAIEDKGVIELDLDELLRLDLELKELKKSVQALQTRKNEIANQVPKAESKNRENLLTEGRELNTAIAKQNKTLKEIELRMQELLWLTPNIPAPFAPLGTNEEQNQVIKVVGEKPAFTYAVRNHRELMKINDWVDFARPVKIAGERAYILKGEMVILEMAIHRMVLNKLRLQGFQLMTVPAFAREDAFYGTGHFPKGRDQVYQLEGEGLFLAGTGEVIINSLHKDEILNVGQLPLLYAAYGPCFRSEAGAAGKDAGGLMRVHQFNKTEQYIICENNLTESAKWHAFMLSLAEEIMADLELPYQVIEACTGDMGLGKYRMNDVEAWVPSENRYRETHSCSTLLEWQARRTNIRYRDKDGDVKYCHTLNCTGIATPRVLVPLLENHQQEDGTISIPEKLKAFL